MPECHIDVEVKTRWWVYPYLYLLFVASLFGYQVRDPDVIDFIARKGFKTRVLNG